jgi:DNA-binding transcriptional regulator/RsmH inhibitor MraZ
MIGQATVALDSAGRVVLPAEDGRRQAAARRAGLEEE